MINNLKWYFLLYTLMHTHGIFKNYEFKLKNNFARQNLKWLLKKNKDQKINLKKTHSPLLNYVEKFSLIHKVLV
jgi:exonuclease V gamma subunit